MGENSFLYEMTPIYMKVKNKNDRVAYPESVHIHLKANSLHEYALYSHEPNSIVIFMAICGIV